MNILEYYDEIGINYVYTKVAVCDYGKAYFGHEQLISNTESILVTADYESLMNKESCEEQAYFFVVLDYLALKDSNKLLQINDTLVCSNLYMKYVINILNEDKYRERVNMIKKSDIEDIELVENILSARGEAARKHIDSTSDSFVNSRIYSIRDTKIADYFSSEFMDMIHTCRGGITENLACALIDGIFEFHTIPFKMNAKLSMALCQLFVKKCIEPANIARIRNLIVFADIVTEPIDPDDLLSILLDILWEDRLLNLKSLGENVKEALETYAKYHIVRENYIDIVIYNYSSILVESVPNLIAFDNAYYYILNDENAVKYISASEYVDIDAYGTVYEALMDNSHYLCDAIERIIGSYENRLYLQPLKLASFYKEYYFPSKAYKYKKMKALGVCEDGIVVVNSQDEIILLGREDVICIEKYDSNLSYTVIGNRIYVEENETNPEYGILSPYYIDLKTGKRIDYVFNSIISEESIDILGVPISSSKPNYEDCIRIGTFNIINCEKIVYTLDKPCKGIIRDGVLICPRQYIFKGRVLFNLSKGKAIISYWRELNDKELLAISEAYGLEMDFEIIVHGNEVDDKNEQDEVIFDANIPYYLDED